MSTLCEVQHLVKVLGKKSPLELAEIYRNAMFFALASDEEGLGIVLLEAMASGLPVVSTACGGPESIVVHGETGILVPTRDAARLCDAMSKLVADPALRKQMGSAGYIRVVEHFSEAVAAKPFLDCYRTALCGQKS
jgi:phosphatidylinositol alpha 1,6-mannosyltransferase